MYIDSRNIAVILLGGRGHRFCSGLPKQFHSFEQDQKKLVFELTAERLTECLNLSKLLFVIPEHLKPNEALLFEESLERLRQKFPEVICHTTKGGEHRHESFERGVCFLKKDNFKDKALIVQDAVRPFLSETFLNRIKKEAESLGEKKPCSIPVIPMTDSLVMKDSDHKVSLSYLERESVYLIQTPQLLWSDAVLKAFAYKNKKDHKKTWTDEGSFMLDMGFPVASYEGDINNKKITYYEDMIP